MPEIGKKILKYKILLVFYADMNSLLEKIDGTLTMQKSYQHQK